MDSGYFTQSGAELAPRKCWPRNVCRLRNKQNEDGLLLEAYFVAGTTLFLLGEFARSQAAYEQGVALLRAAAHQSLISGFTAGMTLGCLSIVMSPSILVPWVSRSGSC